MIYIMFNKPQGYITAKSDANRETIMKFFDDEISEKIHPIGRLDKDTEGLLILTDDGFLDNILMQPQKHIEKTYFFMAMGSMSEQSIKDLENGVKLYGEEYPKSLPCKIEITNVMTVNEARAKFPDYKEQKYLRNPNGCVTCGKITITEGKKHQVKLMLKYAHCTCFYLKRVAIGKLKLDESLKCGEWRYLDEKELEYLI